MWTPRCGPLPVPAALLHFPSLHFFSLLLLGHLSTRAVAPACPCLPPPSSTRAAAPSSGARPRANQPRSAVLSLTLHRWLTCTPLPGCPAGRQQACGHPRPGRQGCGPLLRLLSWQPRLPPVAPVGLYPRLRRPARPGRGAQRPPLLFPVSSQSPARACCRRCGTSPLCAATAPRSPVQGAGCWAAPGRLCSAAPS